MVFFFKIAGALVAGGLLYFSHDHWLGLFFILIAFTSIFAILHSTIQGGLRFLYSLVFICTYIILTFSFLGHVAVEQSYVGLLLISIPCIVYIIPMTLLLIKCRYTIEIFILAWLCTEVFWNNINIGNPFLLIGTPLSYCPFIIQWYQYTGPWGGSLWILAICYILFYTVIKRKLHLSIFIGIIIIPITISACMFADATKNKGPEKVRKVGAISLEANDAEVASLLQANHSSECQYVVCPEAIAVVSQRSLLTHPVFTQIRRSLCNSLDSSTLFVGIFLYANDGQAANSIVVFSKHKQPLLRHKQRPIPFGEYLPCSGILDKISSIRKLIPYDLHPIPNQAEAIHIDIDFLSPLICYESIFVNDVCRACKSGAEIILVSASNELVNSMHCERQILNILCANAITTNRYFVRATQNALSYIIDNRGFLKQKCGISNAFIACNTIFLQEQTFYCKHNAIIIRFYLLLYIGGLMAYVIISLFNRNH